MRLLLAICVMVLAFQLLGSGIKSAEAANKDINIVKISWNYPMVYLYPERTRTTQMVSTYISLDSTNHSSKQIATFPDGKTEIVTTPPKGSKYYSSDTPPFLPKSIEFQLAGKTFAHSSWNTHCGPGIILTMTLKDSGSTSIVINSPWNKDSIYLELFKGRSFIIKSAGYLELEFMDTRSYAMKLYTINSYPEYCGDFGWEWDSSYPPSYIMLPMIEFQH